MMFQMKIRTLLATGAAFAILRRSVMEQQFGTLADKTPHGLAVLETLIGDYTLGQLTSWPKILVPQEADHIARQTFNSFSCPSKSLSCPVTHYTMSSHSLWLPHRPHYHGESQCARKSVNRRKAMDSAS